MRTRSIFMILVLVAVFVAAGVFTASACQKGAPPTGKNSHMKAQCVGKAACDPAMCAKMGCDPAKCAACPNKAQCQAGKKCDPAACKGAAACPKAQAGTQPGGGCGKH